MLCWSVWKSYLQGRNKVQKGDAFAKLQTVCCSSARLQITLLSEDDRVLYCSLMTDKASMSYISSPLSEDKAQRSFEAAIKCNQQQQIQRCYFRVALKSNHQSIGIASVNQLDLAKKHAEIGRMLSPQWHRKGLGTELSEMLIRWLVTELGITTITKQIQAANLAAVCSAQKLGFTKVVSQPYPSSVTEQYQLKLAT
ncbi:GNAT family N-acetyltransferase [Rheinheimera pacifica]|uniref:GNAT family N-acetyltransferase n=1 Tax=Rheinheimera pacifica TaxID=173990 RepID=UPI00286D0AB4|nr:GNAT family N-acetyltransferase [Rheinheimera pacifica]